MGRWEPGARERLQAAALELFLEQGFEQTTVAEIARRVEVTERTFYRHFSDKREVLFDGQAYFSRAFVEGVEAAPADATPAELGVAALDHAASFFAEERRPWSRSRQSVIDSDPGLRERELLKLAHLADELAAAFRARGVPDPQAGLAADSALSVFRSAFARWVMVGETRTFPELTRATLGELRALALG